MLKSIIVLFALYGLSIKAQTTCPTANICGDGVCQVTTHPLPEYRFVCKCRNGQYQFSPCSTSGTSATGKCATNPCGSYPCIEATNFASGFICQCSVNDFRPNSCSTTSTINGCSPNPCKNSGNCVTFDNGSFRGCICPLGFIGTYCETSSSTGTGTNTGTGTGTGTGTITTSFTCTRNGRFKDPTGCTLGRYIECVYYGLTQYPTGIAYVRNCPAGLRYNPTADYCDYPENVTC